MSKSRKFFMNILRIMSISVVFFSFISYCLVHANNRSDLHKFYRKCGLTQQEIQTYLNQAKNIFAANFIEFDSNLLFQSIKTLLPCKECPSCLHEITKACHKLLDQDFTSEYLHSLRFKKLCKVFIFQQIKKSCLCHAQKKGPVARCNHLDEINEYYEERKNDPDEHATQVNTLNKSLKPYKKNFKLCSKNISLEQDISDTEEDYDADIIKRIFKIVKLLKDTKSIDDAFLLQEACLILKACQNSSRWNCIVQQMKKCDLFGLDIFSCLIEHPLIYDENPNFEQCYENIDAAITEFFADLDDQSDCSEYIENFDNDENKNSNTIENFIEEDDEFFNPKSRGQRKYYH